MGQRDLRHLLVQGAHDAIAPHARTIQGIAAKHATNALEQTPQKSPQSPWRIKNARILWSLCQHKTTYDWKRAMGIEEASTS